MPRKRAAPAPAPAQEQIEEMEQRLAQIEVDRKKLEAALAKRRQADLSAFAQSLREQIDAHGYRTTDVIALLKRPGRRASSRRHDRSYTRYVDPENPKRSYARGRMPTWLRQKMEAAGYDANDRAQREEFKSRHLERVA
jgi:DNA-binding protein H-NS